MGIILSKNEIFHSFQSGREMPGVYKFEVLLCTYESLMADVGALSQIPFKAIIVDEAHRIKVGRKWGFKKNTSTTNFKFCSYKSLMVDGGLYQNHISYF